MVKTRNRNRKRKRERSFEPNDGFKRLKKKKKKKKNTTAEDPLKPVPEKHSTLCLYYPRVLSLRDYLLENLPTLPKSRRRKIASIGQLQLPNEADDDDESLKRKQAQIGLSPFCSLNNSSEQPGHGRPTTMEESLAALLDTTLVCVTTDQPHHDQQRRTQDFLHYSQQASLSPRSSVEEEGTSSISEVSTFFFKKKKKKKKTPFHLSFIGKFSTIVLNSSLFFFSFFPLLFLLEGAEL